MRGEMPPPMTPTLLECKMHLGISSHHSDSLEYDIGLYNAKKL